MSDYEKDGDPQFDLDDRGYNVKAWYLKDSKRDALIELTKDGNLLRRFLFPAYKIWNISAHFSDIVDGELEDNDSGYRVAASTGLGGSVGICQLPTEEHADR